MAHPTPPPGNGHPAQLLTLATLAGGKKNIPSPGAFTPETGWLQGALESLERQTRMGSFLWHIPTNMVDLTPQSLRLFGLPPQYRQVPFSQYLSQVYLPDQARVLDTIHQVIASKVPLKLVHRIVMPGGAIKTILLRGEVALDHQGKTLGLSGIIQDAEEWLRTEGKLKLWEKAFQSCKEGILVTDARSIILDVNTAFLWITGYTREEALGKNPSFMKSGLHDKDFYRRMWQSIQTHDGWSGEIWDRKKNGEVFPKWINIQAIRDITGEVSNYIAVFSDLSKAREAEKQLMFLSQFDQLTKLPNRALFMERLRDAIRRVGDSQKMAAVLAVDLDDFKEVTEVMGHDTGDAVLMEAAKRVQAVVGDKGLVSRPGGDEFLVLLEDGVTVDSATGLAQKVIGELSRPVFLGGRDIQMGASAGIGMFPFDGEDESSLLSHADAALAQAKREGGGVFRLYAPELMNRVTQRKEQVALLRRALANQEFELHYQPKLDLKSKGITGMEVLVRWNNPEFGLIGPDQFIPLAEETGLIMPLGEWILSTACAQVESWRQGGMGSLRVAVNMSSRQFETLDPTDIVRRVLRETALPPEALELELTESVVMSNAKRNVATMNGFRRMGIHLSMDDFGTGYSSLSYLKKFPLNSLKIDKSFVTDIDSNPDDLAIAETIIAIGHTLNLKVVAEGVEKQEQLELLESKGCDSVQGYLVSHPLPPERFETWMADMNGKGWRVK
ncbi:MAG: EAL domain-containing protein [Deltaproteobacteria bacterium]|nr:EAL domain-containing protein [Deltaproteobacteria bacterium]